MGNFTGLQGPVLTSQLLIVRWPEKPGISHSPSNLLKKSTLLSRAEKDTSSLSCNGCTWRAYDVSGCSSHLVPTKTTSPVILSVLSPPHSFLCPHLLKRRKAIQDEDLPGGSTPKGKRFYKPALNCCGTGLGRDGCWGHGGNKKHLCTLADPVS